MLHQNERVPHQYVLVEGTEEAKAPPSLRLRSTDDEVASPFVFQFEALGPNTFRTAFSSRNHPLPPFPSARRPVANFGSTPPQVTSNLEKETRTITTSAAKAVITWSDAPIVSLYLNGSSVAVHRDLAFRSYAADNMGIAHYTFYDRDALHVGLGEKAAPMDLSGRSFLVSASDTFGYDAYRTDPLYKHIPLLISSTPNACVGIFSTSHARGSWSVGSEIDGLWGHYKVYRQAHGGLEQYLFVGRNQAEVVRAYAELVGFPLLVPRYMMGYIGGGMKYSMEDEPQRACDTILDFLTNCERHNMPVSAFQMSSGYTVAETEPKTRNVFTWNRHRFPDPRGFTRECHRRGMRILANVKPYVLANHPAYESLARKGAFFTDPVTGKTAVARLWSAGGGESGEGSHLDFTSRAGFDWWYEGCRALKEVGIDGMWNDNNEYNIPSDDWECALETVAAPKGERRRHIGLWGRAMHTELMGKGSHDACVNAEPGVRPLVLTRSATAGTMQYACCSWSGDNVTSWEGMKGGNALALNAGFSLLQCYGHDIGGFEGPQPTPEHLVRWVQLGIHSPRFAINCFKTSAADNLIGDVIEPWMYRSTTPIIRAAIHRRYELVPYTYSLALQSHRTAVPPQRWTGWGYESDPGVWKQAVRAGDTQYWFGDALLIAGVYEPGLDEAKVYLPRKAKEATDYGFLNTNAPFQHFASGKWHVISAPWDASIPVLARCGAAVPVGKAVPTKCREGSQEEEREFPNFEKDDWRGVEIFPPPVQAMNGTVASEEAQSHPESVAFENTWLEDDGVSSADSAQGCEIKMVYEVSREGLQVGVEIVRQGAWAPFWAEQGVDIILPAGEERPVRAMAGNKDKVTSRGADVKGRQVWRLSGLEVKPSTQKAVNTA